MTGLEPAASNVTGWRSNQLSYTPVFRRRNESPRQARDGSPPRKKGEYSEPPPGTTPRAFFLWRAFPARSKNPAGGVKPEAGGEVEILPGLPLEAGRRAGLAPVVMHHRQPLIGGADAEIDLDWVGAATADFEPGTQFLHPVDRPVEVVDRLVMAAEEMEDVAPGVEVFGQFPRAPFDRLLDVGQGFGKIALEQRPGVGAEIQRLRIAGHRHPDDGLRIGQRLLGPLENGVDKRPEAPGLRRKRRERHGLIGIADRAGGIAVLKAEMAAADEQPGILGMPSHRPLDRPERPDDVAPRLEPGRLLKRPLDDDIADEGDELRDHDRRQEHQRHEDEDRKPFPAKGGRVAAALPRGRVGEGAEPRRGIDAGRHASATGLLRGAGTVAAGRLAARRGAEGVEIVAGTIELRRNRETVAVKSHAGHLGRLRLSILVRGGSTEQLTGRKPSRKVVGKAGGTPMPLFEIETGAHIIISWAADEQAAAAVVEDAYPGERIVRLTRRPRDCWVISKSALGLTCSTNDPCNTARECLAKAAGDKVHAIRLYMHETGDDLERARKVIESNMVMGW